MYRWKVVEIYKDGFENILGVFDNEKNANGYYKAREEAEVKMYGKLKNKIKIIKIGWRELIPGYDFEGRRIEEGND